MDTDENYIVDITENLNEIKLFLTCKVCKNLLTEPTILLHCAHTFCNKCLKSTRKCPDCNAYFETRDMLFNHQINYMKNCFIHMQNVIHKPPLEDSFIRKDNVEKVENVTTTKTIGQVDSHAAVDTQLQQSENRKIEQIDDDIVKTINCVWMNPAVKHDVYKRNHLGETELQKACIQNKHETVRMLILKGASVNVVDNFKWSPLHEVVKNGNIKICKLLLDAGSLVDIPNVDYRTPLHLAAEYKQSEIFKMLLEYGADSNLPTYDGIRALDICPGLKEIVQDTRKIYNVIPSVCETTALDVVFAKPQKSSKGKLNIKISTVVTEKTTHFVLNDLKILENVSVHLLKAIVQGLWIVDKNWYSECIEKQENVDPRSYEMKWTTFKCADEFVFKKARINRQLLRPRLFSGCKIYLHGAKYQKNTLVIMKEQMIDIIKAADGEILKRAPKPDCIPTDNFNYPFHARANKLSSCSYYIVYLTEKPYQPEYKFKELRTLPVSWIIDCVVQHKLIDPDEFTNHFH